MSLTHTLEQLIRFRTITGDHAEVHRAFDWIKDQVQPVPLYVRQHTHAGYSSLIMTTKRTKSPKVWLCAHIDVVHGSDQMFHPWIEDGKLYGRGAFDMKFAIACYVELLKELSIDARKYDLGIMLTSDEEVGGFDGTQMMLDKEKYRGEIAFLPDGGEWWKLEERAKGLRIIRVAAQGQSAHGSRPWHGVCAIEQLTAFIHDVREYFATLATDDPGHWYPTMHVGTITGGESMNQIAEHAEATIDMRYPKPTDLRAIETKLRTILKKHPAITIETAFGDDPYGIPKQNGEAKALARIAQKVTGKELGWARSHGSSDARFFARHGIPTLLFWPVAGGAHSEHEWIDIEDLGRFYDVLRAWVEEVAKTS
jgi:succinyl-diaminopimelate desuccinylase